MKKGIISGIILCVLGFGISSLNAQTMSASSTLEAQPIPDRTIPYSISDPGVSKPITWGLDLAWLSEGNIRRGIAFMGVDQVDVVRSSFMPTDPLVNGELQGDALDRLNERLNIISTWLGASVRVVLNSDHPSIDPWFKDANGNTIASRWAQLIDVTARHHQDQGLTVVTASPFNEPDYTATGQGTMSDFYNIAGELVQNYPRFDNIRISGGNTLNTDEALSWYNYLKGRLDEGNTHQLAGSFDNYASFYETVRANGDHASNDELHNVMEAMVGVEYGLQTGIWWGTAELARGEFVKASDGQRLGYSEHRPNWTAASVYRAPNGKIQAFGGTSERQSVTTTYRFVSKDRDVYYDGHGPQREYTMELPGGTGYQQGQTNAERVVNITWGDDIQPVIDGRYVLVNRNSGQVAEVAGGSTAAGANVQQGSYTGATYQQWEVVPVDPKIGGDFSYFAITAVHSGKTMDVNNWSLDNGGGIHVWDDTRGVNQQWYLEYVEDGWFHIRSRHSAKCLEVNGADINQWEVNGNVNQQWRFLPVGAPIEFDPPSAPTDLVATGNAESVRLDWSANPDTDVAGYTIYRSKTSGGPYNTIARGVLTTSFVDNTTTTGGQYFYTIKAVDHSLNRSGYSSEVSATATGAQALVAHLSFDGDIQDGTVNLNHGAVYGGTSFAAGKEGQAISLNGTDAFVQLPSVLIHQQEVTVAAWVYWNGGAAWQRIFDFGNGQDENMFLTPGSGPGTLRFAIKNGGAEQQLNASALPTGAWSHVAVTLGASGAHLYVDGVQADESDAITIRPIDFGPVLNYIGRSQYPDPLFDGHIDDFRVYNYALDADEISTLAGIEQIASGHVYVVESKSSGKVIDIEDGGTANGSKIVQYSNSGSENQQWLFQQDTEGYWSLTSQSATGKVLDVPSCDFTGGVQLNIWDAVGDNCQKFQMVDAGDGYYQIRTRDGSKCVDVNGASSDNFAKIILWDCHAEDNQKWRLIDYGAQGTVSSNARISTFPNPVETDLSIVVGNYQGEVTVEIYRIDGRLEKRVIDYVDGSGRIAVPGWGYKGLGLVRVTTGQDVKVYKMKF